MRKPKYVSQMYGFIFLCLGVAFIICAALVAMGIMQPSSHSMVQDKNTMTLIFSLIGLGFCLTNVVLVFIARQKENQYKELVANSKTVIGTVAKVQYKRGISFGKTSPYVIYFAYSFNGENYYSKSHLAWDNPNLTNGDRIEVFVNDFGKGFIVV